MIKLVATVRSSRILGDLHDWVVVDLWIEGPGAREEWIAHSRGNEVPVAKNETTDAAVAARVEAFVTEQQESANAPRPAPPPPAQRPTALLRVGARLGVDIRPRQE